MARVLKSMRDNPYTAQNYVKDYYNNYTTVSSWLYDMQAMPLGIDRLIFVPCGSGYETVDTSSYPNAFEAQWADFISGVRAGRILYCDGTYGASIVRTIELLYH